MMTVCGLDETEVVQVWEGMGVLGFISRLFVRYSLECCGWFVVDCDDESRRDKV